MLVIFAILLPLILIIGSMVVSIGSWYTHGKHLQTKVDAGAFAGGSAWAFPCGDPLLGNSPVIEEQARKYVGQHMKADGSAYSTTTFNPQVGKVQGDQIHAVLNGPDYYDGDTNPSPSEKIDPAGSICDAAILDVKATEQNSPLLWGWLPFFPDIKKKARVQIEETEGVSGLLPIAVRVPAPVSMAVVFYDQTAGPTYGTILDNDAVVANGNAVRYFYENNGIFGLPSGLGGWSTFNAADLASWSKFNLSPNTGVAIAISFRRACATNAPPGLQTGAAPCFEDVGFSNVNQLCNQGSTTQVAQCFFSTGDWPTQAQQPGLHFIHGFPDTTFTNAPPKVEEAWLTNNGCNATAYFNQEPINGCSAQVHVKVDLGSVMEDPPPNPPVGPEQTRKASNVEVKYRVIRADGSDALPLCNNYGANCELQPGNPNAQGEVEYRSQGSGVYPHMPLSVASRGNAIAIQIRVKGSTVVPNPGNCGPGLGGFSNNCRWFHTGNGIFGTSVDPTPAQILGAPIQQSFMGTIDDVGAIKWIRLTSSTDCTPAIPLPDITYDEVPSQPTNAGVRCFFVDVGLKGGLARDQDEPQFSFNEGTGSSQMGSVNCDPDIPQGQELEDAVQYGCKPFFGSNGFDTVPLCPGAGAIFNLPNPGPPWNDWPPIECIERRPTGSMNQLEKGLNLRLFGSKNSASCPPDLEPPTPTTPGVGGFKWGRNYWHNANNNWDITTFADDRNTPQKTDDLGNRLSKSDPRLVNLFFTPYDSFGDKNKSKVYPIVKIGGFYITGYGRWQGNKFQGNKPDDPCSGGNVGDPLDGLPAGQGNEPPPDLRACGGNCSGMIVWGHFLNDVKLGGSATPSGVICKPIVSNTCIAVLVE